MYRFLLLKMVFSDKNLNSYIYVCIHIYLKVCIYIDYVLMLMIHFAMLIFKNRLWNVIIQLIIQENTTSTTPITLTVTLE